jgi:hypothetical protein
MCWVGSHRSDFLSPGTGCKIGSITLAFAGADLGVAADVALALEVQAGPRLAGVDPGLWLRFIRRDPTRPVDTAGEAGEAVS